MNSHRVHIYTAACVWRGSTAAGYEHYERTHQAAASPATTTLSLSSDAAFRGDTSQLNPEQLLVIAASSCQLLSFLAVAARAHLDVVEYEDDVEAVMPEADKPVRITAIKLRPRIVVKGEVSEERVRHLVEVAHRECFIANSLKSEITIEPKIEVHRNMP